MGIYKRRTEFINEAINRNPPEDIKRLLSVGFIPSSLEEEYKTFMSNSNADALEDTDLDKISNENYFAVNPDKVAGTLTAGTGFLNPVLVKGNIEDVLNSINKTLSGEAPKKYLTDKHEILSALTEMAAKAKSLNSFLEGVQFLAGNFGIDNTSEEFIQAVGLIKGNPEKNKQILKNFYLTQGMSHKNERKEARKEAITNANVENIINLAETQEREFQEKIKNTAAKEKKFKKGDIVEMIDTSYEPTMKFFNKATVLGYSETSPELVRIVMAQDLGERSAEESNLRLKQKTSKESETEQPDPYDYFQISAKEFEKAGLEAIEVSKKLGFRAPSNPIIKLTILAEKLLASRDFIKKGTFVYRLENGNDRPTAVKLKIEDKKTYQIFSDKPQKEFGGYDVWQTGEKGKGQISKSYAVPVEYYDYYVMQHNSIQKENLEDQLKTEGFVIGGKWHKDKGTLIKSWGGAEPTMLMTYKGVRIGMDQEFEAIFEIEHSQSSTVSAIKVKELKQWLDKGMLYPEVSATGQTLPKFERGDTVKYIAGDIDKETWYGVITKVNPANKKEDISYRLIAFNIEYRHPDSEATNEKYEVQLTKIEHDTYYKKLHEWEAKFKPVSSRIQEAQKQNPNRIFVVKPDTGSQKTTTTKQPMANKEQNLNPKVEVKKSDLAIIKANNLLEDDTNGKKTQTTTDTIKKYNPAITEDEIKAWVYYKRKFGNPMKGWEKYFLAGGAGSNILLRTTKETTVKDNKYVDLRTIPNNTILGAKTKFKNTYGTDTLVICKTPTGELVWVNVADVKEIKNVTSESQAEIDKLVNAKALIFDGNEYYPYPVYLFGNIYEKINSLNENRQLIVDKYTETFADEQMALVRGYLPKMKSFRDPVRNNRPHILCLSEFANSETQFGIKGLHEETGIKLGSYKRNRFQEVEEGISLFEAFKQWMEEFVKDTELKGTTRANIKKYYFAKSVSWEKDPNGNDVLSNTQKEELIGAARQAAEELFSDFLATALTFEDSVALDGIWNEKYNSFTSVTQFVDKVPIGWDGSTMFKTGELGVKPAQRQGLAYLQLTGSGCLAYDVGFGKTAVGILNIAQLLSQGAIRRPLIVVPKPTYKNWLKELFGYWTDGEKVSFKEFQNAVYHYGILSGIKVNVNDWYNLSGKHYQKLLAENGGDINKAIPDNTITVVSYKGFEQMGFSRNVSDEMFDSIARVLMQKDVVEGQAVNEKKEAKAAATFYQKMQGWLGVGNKNAVINIDTCGFDHITVDEAHNFKNVFPTCGKDAATGRKLFGISAGQSSRAVKMFFITNYIQAKYGKKVTLLTATPFTNSPLEIYSMLSFVGLETLNQYNLFNIKKFFEQFVLETIEYAIDSKGEIITKPVIKSFENLKLLQTILFNHFHHKDDPKEAGVVRPCRIDLPNKDISTYLEMNEWQRKNQVEVKIMAKSVSRQNPGAGLKAMSMSLDNAFSPFLFAKEQPESAEDFINQSPKIKFAVECIKSVKDWHESRGEETSGIILYSNRGVSYFDYIKDYLINTVGYKSNISYGDDEDVLSEVEIISGGGGEADEDRKELIKDAFNAGVVKVIIGTGTIREGINLQSRSALTIDLYPEWNPTDITQLKGRNWRQGNMYGYVRFVMPLVINSMDNFINQKLDEKSKRIANLWKPIGDMNKLENSADLDPAEIKYALVDDAGEKFKMKFETIKNDMNREFVVLSENNEMLATIASNIEDLKQAEERLFEDISEKKPAMLAYQEQLKKLDLKVLKEKGLTKTVKDIERVTNNLAELIEAIGKYEANRYDIPMLLIAVRLIKQRDYNVFTDASSTGRSLESVIKGTIDYYTFNVYTSAYDSLVSAWSTVRKAEKSVLNAYGKSWQDDISQIKKDILNKIDKLKLQAEHVQSDQYKEAMLSEINAEMEAAKSVRGDLDEQVKRFASLNHTLSYLSDNTDKENCPIPTDPCCPTNGFNVVHTDKEHPEPVISKVPSKKPAPLSDEEKQIREAIEFITEMLPDLKGKEKKEAQEAIGFLTEMLPAAHAQMAQGGPVISSSEAQAIWDNWTLSQRVHWLEEHEFGYYNMAFEYEELDKDIADTFLRQGGKEIKLANGGPAEDIDLFEHAETLPKKVQNLITKYEEEIESGEKDRYALARQMEKKFAALGYGFDWGLDGEPFDLHKITSADKPEPKESYSIKFLNKKKKFSEDEKFFSSYEEAKKWGKKNLENFNLDMIRMQMSGGGPADRSLAALNKDRKYFNPEQGHEVRYANEHGRKKLRYDKLSGGGLAGGFKSGNIVLHAHLGHGKILDTNGNNYDVIFWDEDRKEFLRKEIPKNSHEMVFSKKPLDRTGNKITYDLFSKERMAEYPTRDIRGNKLAGGGPIEGSNKDFIFLSSVSTYIDPQTADTYAADLTTGEILNPDEPIMLADIEVKDWFENLSKEDKKTVAEIISQLRKGGPVGRSLAALNKDHKYFNAAQEHEVRYAKEHHRKKKTYKK